VYDEETKENDDYQTMAFDWLEAEPNFLFNELIV